MLFKNRVQAPEEITWETVKIDLNGDDTSDLILYKRLRPSFKNPTKDGYYYNTKTNEKSSKISDLIREDKRFIVPASTIEDMEKLGVCEYGYYAKYVEELDMMIIVNARLGKVHGKWEWVEIERFFFTRDLQTNFCDGINSILGYDICGQTAYNDEKLRLNIRYLDTYAVESKKRFLDFYGGLIWTYRKNDCYITKMYDFDSENDFDFESIFLETRSSAVDVVVGMLEYGCEGMELGDVPQSFFDKVKKKRFERFKDGYTDGFAYTSYLQQVGDCYVQRCFKCIYDYKYPAYETDVIMVEYLRIKVDLDMQNKNFMKSFSSIIVDGYEIGEGTCLEHVKGFIENFDTLIYSDICGYAYKCYLMPTILNIAAYSPFEKLLNLNAAEDMQYYQKTIITRFVRYIEEKPWLTAADYMKQVFGEIDESQSKLHKALGIPKGLLEYAIQKDETLNFEYIKTMKEIFADNPEYLRRMDDASYRNLYDSVEGIMVSYHPLIASQTLINLAFLFGYENWKGYVAHIQRLQAIKDAPVWRGSYTFPNIRDYSDYVNKLVAIKKNVDVDFPMQWKVYGSKITEAELAIRSSYNILIDEKEYAECTKKFFECSDKWKEYEYVGDEYVVQYPKKPSELVNEGFWLNHCVKNYIEVVANNDTMVLFIRRKEQPDKPFYTLEIRNRKVRQCHGYNNNNIDAISGLENFLEAYCSKKGVIYRKGDSCLDV